ncbi:MAG: PQQ-dependent sugar dehydrogenase [Myxococcota bacterium]
MGHGIGRWWGWCCCALLVACQGSEEGRVEPDASPDGASDADSAVGDVGGNDASNDVASDGEEPHDVVPDSAAPDSAATDSAATDSATEDSSEPDTALEPDAEPDAGPDDIAPELDTEPEPDTRTDDDSGAVADTQAEPDASADDDTTSALDTFVDDDTAADVTASDDAAGEPDTAVADDTSASDDATAEDDLSGPLDTGLADDTGADDADDSAVGPDDATTDDDTALDPDVVGDDDETSALDTAVDDDVTAPDASPDASIDAGDSSPDVDDPTELPPFSYATACQVGQMGPSQAGGSALQMPNAFPELAAFSAPIDLTHANDGSGRVFVVERAGRVIELSGPQGAHVKRTFLDIRSKVYTGGECGLLGIAFHPRFASNGYVFTTYCQRTSGQTTSYLTRWSVDPADPHRLDPASEVELLRQDQPFDNHKGGSLHFGPDGFLYLSFGDGGSANDPFGNGQRLDTLLGKILRIDVDHGADGKAYAIPADNPFAVGGSARPEICAWGLRNPWRTSFDRLTGELWVGDVGQGAWEEVDVVSCGRNYGWSVMEGAHCRPGGPGTCGTSGLELPVLEYPHSGSGTITGAAISGGFVYRGTRAPSLWGRYVFADYVSNFLATWQRGEPTPANGIQTPTNIAAFGEDEDGEVYLLGLVNGRIYRLEDAPTVASPPPATLSATGCFADLASLTPTTGVLPYALNLPFWSDGAVKSRWLVLPPGGTVGFATHDKWTLPAGSVLIKHFERADPLGGGMRRIETRFLVKQAEGVRGWSYRWRADGLDADLVTAGADVVLPDTEASTFVWSIPSSSQCTACHRTSNLEGGDGVLGLETRQLDRDVVYAGHGPFRQIDAWATWGLFDSALPDADQWPPPYEALDAPIEDEEALEDRARSWLAVNCAFCHQPDGPSGTAMDWRRDVDLAAAGVCDVVPEHGDVGLDDARLVTPGDSGRSVVHERLVRGPPWRMPPLGSHLFDEEGAAVVRDWIDGLEDCP